MQKRNSTTLILGSIAAFVFCCLVIGPILPLRLNESNSVPLGIYLIQTQPAPYAGLCMDEKTLQAAFQAGLRLNSGECPNGRETILKTIFKATPEQPIRFSQEGFTVGDRTMANTAPKAISRTGKPLQHAPYGEWTSGLFAISNYNRDSWDSRYFGPITEAEIRYYAKPLWLF